MTIREVLVVGGGTMGGGIAQLCAQQGFAVTVADIAVELAQATLSRIEAGLGRRVERGKITEADRAAVMARLSAAGDLAPAAQADIVIESVAENLEIKQQVFAQLDARARPEVILLTNTTALPISAIADATGRPDRVCQMHFFNPAVIMKLVEIMPGSRTSAATLDAAAAFARALDKDPVVCKKEAPAGIVSRALGQLLNEATWMVEAGVADPADIDKAMRLGANHRMGPLELIDLIGLDIHRAKMRTLRAALGDGRYDHPPIVDALIAQGHLGKKAGRGFYDYGGGQRDGAG